jgi:iron complex outermembrane receptor protein
MPKSTVRSAIRGVLATGIAVGLSLNAQAQTSSTGQPASLGELTVIGQPAQPLDISSATPVLTINRAEINATGLKTVDEVLQRLTIAGSAPNATFNFGSTGATNVDLRNLGSERVLVLVNGRRWATSLDGNVDLTTIPLAIVDHIEILKAGDSARFGSGAIAGVINLVTRDRFSGAEASAYYGQYIEGSHHDGTVQTYDFTLGTASDRGSLVANASYFRQEPIFAGDRDISAFPRYGTGVTRGSGTTSQGRFTLRDPATGEVSDLTVKEGTPGTSLSDFRPFNPLTDFYNFQTANYLLAPSQRTGLYLQGRYELLPELTLHTTMFYEDRESNHHFGPSEVKIGANTAFPISISASNPYNPFGYDLTATGSNPTLLSFSRQLTETGGRLFEESVGTYYFEGGFGGQLPGAANALAWDVSYIFNKSQLDSLSHDLINTQKLANALGPVSDCPGTTDPDCVPLNVFGGQYQGGTITPAMLDYITYTGHRSILSRMRDVTARVSGPIIDLPAGPMAFEAGYEHREVDGSDVPDSVSAAGNSFGDFESPASGGFQVNAAYAGVNVPLLADLPFARALEVDLAARHADFDTFGTINASRAGLRWQPTTSWVVRANWSEDFRAPTVREMFGGTSVATENLADPCSGTTSGSVAAACTAAGVPAGYVQPNAPIRTVTGANPNLKPETSISRGLGFVFTPAALPALNLNVDYWKIEVDDTIAQLDPEQVLLGCYQAGEPAFCGQVQRAPSGAITEIRALQTNTGSVLTEGFDAGINYVLTTDRFGQFAFDWQTTYLRNYKETVTHFGNSGSEPIVTRRAGQEFGRLAGFPRFRSNFDVDWAFGNWSVDWLVRYISDMSEQCSDRYDGTSLSLTNLGLCAYPNFADNHLSRNKLGAATYHDVRASYNFAAANTTVSFGVRNLFDKQPPVSMTAGSSFETTIYPIPGRFPYVSVESRF